MNGSVEVKNTVTGTLDEQKSLTGNLSLPTEKVIDGDYNKLSNKPSIEGVVLEQNKTFKQLGLDTLSVQEIEKILYLD